MSNGIILVHRHGPIAATETRIQLLQDQKVWWVDPIGDRNLFAPGYESRYNSVTSFMDGLTDAGFQVIVHRNFADRPFAAFEHKRLTSNMVRYTCYLYGLAFGLNQWDDVMEQASRLPRHHRHKALMRTGRYYAANPWAAQISRCVILR